MQSQQQQKQDKDLVVSAPVVSLAPPSNNRGAASHSSVPSSTNASNNQSGQPANPSQSNNNNTNNHALDFIIQSGELGQSFTYHSIPASKEITYLQQLVQTDMKIDVCNQYLLPKSGFQIQPDDVLGEIERQNALSQTQRLVDQSKFKSFHVLFVFNEKALLDTSETVPTFIQHEHQAQLAQFSKISADVKSKAVKLDHRFAESDFPWAMSLSEEEIFTVMKVAPAAIELETKLYKFYASMKKKAYEYLQKQGKIEKGCKEIDVQSSAIESILMRAINEYQICKKFSSDIQSKLKVVSENMTKILAKYEEALHLGRTTDLPDILKKEGRKHIFDVYYGLQQMENWKDHCIKRMENLKVVFTQNQTDVKTIKMNIKQQRSITTTSATQASNELVKKVEDSSKEGSEAVLSAFVQVYEEYKMLRKLIQMILEGGDEVTVSNQLDSVISKATTRLTEQEGVERMATQKIEGLGVQFSSLLEHKQKTYQKMKLCHQKLAPILKDLSKLSHEKFKQFTQELAVVDKDFNDFHKPYQFFNSFKTILKEVSRRNEFQSLIERCKLELEEMEMMENEKRKAFIYQYGRCLPKDFIPELTTYAKPIVEYASEKYPRIENEHDDKYNEYFKQFESQEFAMKQEEKIQELKRELLRLKESNGGAALQMSQQQQQNNNNKLKAGKKDEVESANIELRTQISLLKNEIEMMSQRKPEDSLRIQLDIEAKKNGVLQSKLQALENQVRSKSDDAEKDKMIAKQQKELDEFDKVFKSIHHHYQKDNKENLSGGMHVNGDGVDVDTMMGSEEMQRTIQKLNVRVTNLTVLLQQTSKVAFNSFLRKQSETQQKLLDKITAQEQKFLSLQESSLADKNKLVTFYDDKIKSAENRYYADTKKILTSLELAKEQYKEELSSLNAQLKNADSDLADKNKQLRSAQENIAKLNSQINQKQKEYEELSKKSQLVESRLKADLQKQVGDAQAASLKEQERLKKRIAQLEVDIANKMALQTNALKDLAALKRELDLKTDEHQKVLSEVDTTRRENESMKRDVLNLKNKIENLESGNEKRNRELAQLTKSLNAVGNEKQMLFDELQKEKSVIVEVQKKLQGAVEAARAAESEKARLMKAVDAEKLEVEKKNIEITNLQRQVVDYSQQKTLELEKHKETQITDKLRVADLTEDIQKYKIELNVVQTKVQILEADLSAREHEIRILKENIERHRAQAEESEAKIEELVQEMQKIESDNEQKTAEISNLNAAYEQALIEGEIQQKNASKSKSQLERKEDEFNHEVERLENEILELQRNIDICQEREKKTNVLNLEINTVLSEVRAKLADKEKELQTIQDEMSVSRSTVNLKEMSLKQLNSEMRDRDDRLISTQESLRSVTEQLEDSQQQMTFVQSELDSLRGALAVARDSQQLVQNKNLELQDTVDRLTSREVEYQKTTEQTIMEKEVVLQQYRAIEEQMQHVESEKQVLYTDNTVLARQLENLQANTICIDVHQQTVEKLEQEILEKEIQKQEIIKEQGQLAEQLISAEITLKELRHSISVKDELAQRHLQTIERLNLKVNVQKTDLATQWEEDDSDERQMTLSTSEANKFKKILRGIDSNKRIPVMSSRTVEHMDISMALRRTALIQETINFTRLEEGTKMLFIPTSDSVYVPLILRQINDGAIIDNSVASNDSLSLSIASYKNNFFLDFDTLDRKYKELLRECSLLMVATIKNIIPKQAYYENNNQFGLKENESYFLLQVEMPEYVVGLEDDDHSIKNYA